MGKYIAFVLHLDFFHKYQIDPKEYKGDDVLHSCNRLFMCLISKFDELKQFHFKQSKKKTYDFLECLESFSNVKPTLEKV